MDNVVVTLPDPPISSLAGIFTGDIWRVEFTGQTNWLYTLERTADLHSWTAASPVTAGVEGPLFLEDSEIGSNALYRVRAERP